MGKIPFTQITLVKLCNHCGLSGFTTAFSWGKTFHAKKHSSFSRNSCLETICTLYTHFKLSMNGKNSETIFALDYMSLEIFLRYFHRLWTKIRESENNKMLC